MVPISDYAGLSDLYYRCTDCGFQVCHTCRYNRSLPWVQRLYILEDYFHSFCLLGAKGLYFVRITSSILVFTIRSYTYFLYPTGFIFQALYPTFHFALYGIVPAGANPLRIIIIPCGRQSTEDSGAGSRPTASLQRKDLAVTHCWLSFLDSTTIVYSRSVHTDNSSETLVTSHSIFDPCRSESSSPNPYCLEQRQ